MREAEEDPAAVGAARGAERQENSETNNATDATPPAPCISATRDDLLREYIAAGFALVPIPPLADGRMPKGPEGESAKGWNKRENCVTTVAQLARIKPGWNVGLAHVYSGTWALDIDDMARARPWLAEHQVDLDALLADRYAVRIDSGRENRAKLLYRLPPGTEPIATKKLDAEGLEFRCATAGGLTMQDVLPPSIHPDTGQPYRWRYNDDLLAHFSIPPEAPPELIALWLSVVARGESKGEAPPSTGVDLRALSAALSVCREEASHYDTWAHWGIAIHRATGGSAEGFALWVRWSTLDPVKFAKAGNLRAKWKSFAKDHPNPITVATIFARARALRPDIGATAFEDVTATPAAKGNAPAAPTIENGAELMRRAFAPLRWCVPDLLPEGAYLLAARPKIGKSWLALGIALAIATGERYLGRDIVKGEVLYLALEDNPRRMQSRIKTLRPFEDDGPALADFYYHTEWPRVDQGGAERVKAWLAEHPRARLVIIDTLARVRAKSTRRDGGNSYDDDYAAGQALKAIADAAGVAVLIVTHTRKTEAADPLDLVTGTLGLAGAVDGALVLERARGRDSADLHVIGRDIENEKTWALRFERGAWELLGDAAKIRVSDQRRRILEVLEAEGPQSPKDIASALGARGDAIRQLLRTMRIAGEVEQGTNGQYLLPV